MNKGGKEERILKDLKRVADGKNPQDPSAWREDLDSEFRRWKKKWPGSMNLPRMAHAIQCREEPRVAARFFRQLITREEQGIEESKPQDARVWYWTSFEPFSANYWGWSWLGEAVAAKVLSEKGGFDETVDILHRSLRRHAGMAALVAIRRMVLTNHPANPGNKREIYRGPGCFSAGARSNPAHFFIRSVNSCFSRASQMLPDFHRRNWIRIEDKIADAIDPHRGWGLGPEDRHHLVRLVENNNLESARHVVERLAPGTKTYARFEIRRYADRGGCTMFWNVNGNTSATYYGESLISGDAKEQDMKFIHPYCGEERVRGGTALGKKLLGKGEAKLLKKDGAEIVECANLTQDEANNPGKKRCTEGWQLPQGRPVLRFECGPDQALRLVEGQLGEDS